MKKQNRIVSINILSTLLLNGISIFTSPLFSRMLGTSGYGVTSVYTIWVSAAAIVFSLQSQGTLANARVEYPEEEQAKYQSSVMSLSMLSFLCFSVVVLLFAKPVSGLLQLRPFLLVLLLVHAFGSFVTGFVGNKFTFEFKAGRNFALSMTVTLLNFGLSFLLISLMPEEINYYGRIFALAITYGSLGIGFCIYILLKGKTFYNREYWRFCLTLALPVVFYNLSDLVLGQSDRVMLQKMLSDSDVGIYSYSCTFGNIMFTIFHALNNSWCPLFFDDMKHGRRDALKQQAGNFLELYTVLSMGFVLLSTEVFHLYAREDFWGGTILIPVFVAGNFLNFLCTFPINYEYYCKKTKIVAAVTISSSLVNIALNYFLIRRLGIFGAALATMLSHCLQLTLHYLYTRYVLGKVDYPFGVRMWAKHALIFFAVAVFAMLTPDWWLVRWGIGAALGVWELMRIRRRKVLI